MKSDSRFLNKSPRFWAHAKYISEQLGYCGRRSRKSGPGQLKKHDINQAHLVLGQQGFMPDVVQLEDVVTYLNWRADKLNEISALFMDRNEAAAEFERLKAEINPARKLAMNKQKGDKRHPAYLANMVGMIAEKALGPEGFVDDARRLAIVTSNNMIEEIFSRRFDGAFPDTRDPKAVWEIKEYYGTTTFGSRVADGVYETLLDGFELNGVLTRMGRNIQHYLFIDDRYTWWDCGKSYLCRMVDMLHTGHVNEIFFGRQVLTDWEKTLRSLQ